MTVINAALDYLRHDVERDSFFHVLISQPNVRFFPMADMATRHPEPASEVEREHPSMYAANNLFGCYVNTEPIGEIFINPSAILEKHGVEVEGFLKCVAAVIVHELQHHYNANCEARDVLFGDDMNDEMFAIQTENEYLFQQKTHGTRSFGKHVQYIIDYVPSDDDENEDDE